MGEFTVHVDHVPSDAFAGPARLRVALARDKAKLPDGLVDGDTARIALEDHLAREAFDALARQGGAAPNAPPGIGRILLERPGPAVVERNVCRVLADAIQLRVAVDLPAASGWIRGLQAAELFEGPLTRLAMATLLFSARRLAAARRAVDTALDHAWLQEELKRRGLVAFVADGSVLPRTAARDSMPFHSPDSLAVAFDLPRSGRVRGMGVPSGVTVLAGGAFQGKTTLLEGIAAGAAPHPPGDGRERVVTVAAAVEVRAEAARAVRAADLTPFVRALPAGGRPADVTLDAASGAVAQAASVLEAVEAGSNLLLFDEDHAAPAFWVRDGRMARLVPAADDPLVPLVDRLRALHASLGVSTILATSGAGDFLAVADTVIRMTAFSAHDVTKGAREIARATQSMRPQEPPAGAVAPGRRWLRAPSGASARVAFRPPREIRVGDDLVNLEALGADVEPAQLRALALLLRAAPEVLREGCELREAIVRFERLLAAGLDLDGPASPEIARPRALHIAAALSRWPRLCARRSDAAK